MISKYANEKYRYIEVTTIFLSLFIGLGVIVHIVMKEYNKKIIELKKNHDKLHELSITDSMTGLCNRRYIMNLIQQQLQAEGNNFFSVVMLDIDKFKSINDTYGHSTGDVVIKEIASTLKKNIRISDIIGRIGGEEFLIMLKGANIQEAYQVSEKLRKHVENLTWNEFSHSVTISIGAYQVDCHDTLNELLEKVDAGLYQAKRTGRNKVIVVSN